MASFNGSIHLTRGIQSRIPVVLQLYLWAMLSNDQCQNLPMDYLQVFTLSSVTKQGKHLQQVIHTQEQPPRKRAVLLDLGEAPVTTKIFVIDDGMHVTMLLAEEY